MLLQLTGKLQIVIDNIQDHAVKLLKNFLGRHFWRIDNRIVVDGKILKA